MKKKRGQKWEKANRQRAESGRFSRDEDCLLPVSELSEVILLPAFARPGDEEPVVVESYLSKYRSAEFNEGTEKYVAFITYHSAESDDKEYSRVLSKTKILKFILCNIELYILF